MMVFETGPSLRLARRKRKVGRPFGCAPKACLVGTCFALAFAAVIFAPAAGKSAGCVDRLQPPTVEAFLDNPEEVFESVRSRDLLVLTGQAEAFAIHSGRTLDLLIKIIAEGSSQQKISIARGMAGAVNNCQTIAPDVARRVKLAAQRVSDPGFKRAFFQALAEDETPPAPALGGGESGEPRKNHLDADVHKALPLPGASLGSPFDPLDTVRRH